MKLSCILIRVPRAPPIITAKIAALKSDTLNLPIPYKRPAPQINCTNPMRILMEEKPYLVNSAI